MRRLLLIACTLFLVGCAVPLARTGPEPFCLPPGILADFLAWPVIGSGIVASKEGIVGWGVRYEHRGQAVVVIWWEGHLRYLDADPDGEMPAWERRGEGCEWERIGGRSA